MSVVKVQNIVATTGEYTDNQGNQKKRYQTIGTIFTYDDGGQSIKLEMVPLNWDGNASVYDRKEQQNQHGNQSGGQGQPQNQPQGGYNQPQSQPNQGYGQQQYGQQQ